MLPTQILKHKAQLTNTANQNCKNKITFLSVDTPCVQMMTQKLKKIIATSKTLFLSERELTNKNIYRSSSTSFFLIF